eukprot:8007083-Alexandrium_andersonii.AAC.1
MRALRETAPSGEANKAREGMGACVVQWLSKTTQALGVALRRVWRGNPGLQVPLNSALRRALVGMCILDSGLVELAAVHPDG